ncbi:MAG: cobyric acid synthase, partial [Rhodobiaceae bacterium]|nr:cobyric acid synthase [Rhodobiaceae bacterium]
FKPQNMSNNAAVTADGGEIGRAQALQARACGVPPSVHMNPVLLKPETDTGAQVIVQGRRHATLKARDYGRHKAELMPRVMESFATVGEGADLVIVEGAGSPAEINLRAGDIANMGFAIEAGVPVVLIGDIDRGGVIASLVGTHAVLPDAERNLIRGFAINRFRGDASLFADGMREIERRTGWAGLGIVPWFEGARRLPAEDALDLARGGSEEGPIRIAVPVLGRIANFDDLDPLRLDPAVSLTLVQPGDPLPGDCHLVILPGSKSTIADLAGFRANGWDIDLAAHVRRGGHVLGLCGGYQMLGRTVADPDGIEGRPGSVPGLGLLDVETVLTADKATRPARGTDLASGLPVEGYEIHLGETAGPDTARRVFDLGTHTDGAASPDGRVVGTYVHGLFSADDFRRRYLARFGAEDIGTVRYDATVEATLDALADHLETHLDIDRIVAIAREGVAKAQSIPA